MQLQNSAFCRSNNHGKEVIDMVKTLARGKQYLTDAYWSAVGMASAAMLTLQPVLATGTGTGTGTIWNRFSTILKDVYGQVVAISTIVAVTVAAIALLIRMISRNQRAVDEATNWLKRIVVTWIILNSLGFVDAYLQPLIQGGNYSG
jgi:putative copper export protein